jgi:hypothetical protein
MNDAKICFLLGIMPRSGTNYLANLMECHSDVIIPGPVWEDFFVSNSDKLNAFIKSSKKYWNPSWDRDNKLLSKDKLLNCLGTGLLSFLDLQRTEQQTEQLLVAKTPTVRNLKNFFKLFPNNKIIILVRDGRNVVSSGEKSFKWDFEKSSKDWANAVSNIREFIESNKQFEDQILLIRYEDIYTSLNTEIKKVLKFLQLDEESFDWERAKNMGISGSSDTVDSNGEVTWENKVEPSKSFNPMERYKSWPMTKKLRFEWLAGDETRYLGYETEPSNAVLKQQIIQRFLDCTWYVRVIPSTVFYLLMKRNFILKSH